MAVGANIKYRDNLRILSKFFKILTQKQYGIRSRRKLCYKAGAPANDTAADNPNAKYDICVDTTNNDIYICTAWTSDASATTWVKITD